MNHPNMKRKATRLIHGRRVKRNLDDMSSRITGYFEKDGSYNEAGHPKQSGPDLKSKAWFENLSPGHREVIQWWNGTFGSGLAQFRNHDTQAFSRSLGMGNMTGPEQHEFAYEHFEDFKTFCLNQRKTVNHA